jgi:hypothetical protein
VGFSPWRGEGAPEHYIKFWLSNNAGLNTPVNSEFWTWMSSFSCHFINIFEKTFSLAATLFVILWRKTC